MKKLLASFLCAAMAFAVLPISLDAAAPVRLRQGNIGQIAGHATKDGKPLANYTVRLRNVDTKQLVGSMTSDATGAFNFTGLPVGNYVVETVDGAGNIIATSTVLGLTAGAMVLANVGVGASAAVAGGVAGAGAIGGAAGGLTATTVVVTSAAVLAGTTLAVVAVNNNASPSQ